MLQMIGRSAHSAFRLAKLLALLQENNSNITALRSEYRYFIEPKDEHELNPTEQDLLSTLLEARQCKVILMIRKPFSSLRHVQAQFLLGQVRQQILCITVASKQ